MNRSAYLLMSIAAVLVATEAFAAEVVDSATLRGKWSAVIKGGSVVPGMPPTWDGGIGAAFADRSRRKA